MTPHRHFRSFAVGACITMLVLLLAPQTLVHANGVSYVVPGGSGARTGVNWANAKDLQVALSDATNGDQLWVKAGTYKPDSGSGNPYATFQLKSGVAIYGGFAGTETQLSERNVASNLTILSGDIDNNDSANPALFPYQVHGSNSYHIVTGNNTDSTGILDGFTITGGNADHGVFPEDRGGGMANMTNANPTLRNLVFSGNSAGYGGGMIIVGSSPTLDNVTFLGNSASSNGGAMYSHIGGNPTLTNVTFIGNTAGYGGAGMSISSSSNPTLRNVIFTGNHAVNRGGAIATNAANITLINVTITGNSANTGGGICSQFDSNPIIRNSILWNNSGGDISNVSSNVPNIQYSLIQGGYSGTGNISGDPQFTTPTNPDTAPTTTGDFHLLSNSPAVDAGNNSVVEGAVDRDGKPRIVGSRVDMGAYEQSSHIVGGAVLAATYGASYSYTFDTVGITNPTFNFAGTLPPGLNFTGGVLSGTPTAVGTFPNITITASGTDSTASKTFTVVVKKAVLTVTADDKHKLYHEANPLLTANFSGFVNSDTANVIGGNPELTTSATLFSPVGQYPITATVGTLSAANYIFVFVKGTLTVDPGPPRPPIVGEFTLNGGASTTTLRNVTIRASVTDADDSLSHLLMSFSNDGSAWSDWQPYAPTAPWQLTSGDGVKPVYGRFKNSAGDVSAVVSDTIELNTSVQAAYSVTINDAALYANQVSVQLTISARPGTADMQVSNDGGFGGIQWEPYAAHKAWEITRYGNYITPRIVYIRFRDLDGSISATYQDDILLDITPPTGEVQVTAPSSITAASNAIQLQLTATDDLSGIGGMRLSSKSDFAGASWEPFATSKTWEGEAGSAVYVQFRDNAGNVSQTYVAPSASQHVVFLPVVHR